MSPDGLWSGWGLRSVFPDDTKKAWLKAIRELAGIDCAPAGWADRSDGADSTTVDWMTSSRCEIRETSARMSSFAATAGLTS